MAIVFITLGVLLLVSVINDEQDQLASMVEQDIFNAQFLSAFGVIMILYLIAQTSATARKPATLFAALVVLGLFLAQGEGFFSQLETALANPQAGQVQPPAPPSVTQNPTINVNGGSSGSSAGGILGGLANTVLGAVTGGGSQDFSG
jgi:hypothetical protein